jgi:hypothetical protein
MPPHQTLGVQKQMYHEQAQERDFQVGVSGFCEELIVNAHKSSTANLVCFVQSVE